MQDIFCANTHNQIPPPGTTETNRKGSRISKTAETSKTRSTSVVSSSRKSARGATTNGMDFSKEEVVEATAKKISVTHGGPGDAGIGGLMRPTKSWLNHLGETGGQSSKGSASLTNRTDNGGTADDGTAVVTRKNSSQKGTQETSSSSVSSSSTTSFSSASTTSAKSESSKEKNLPTNNKVGNPPTLTDGKESEVVQGKESHSAGEQKEPASKINGIVKQAKRTVNGKKKIENGKDDSRTTMVIQLHSGKTKKLSAYLENQVRTILSK